MPNGLGDRNLYLDCRVGEPNPYEGTLARKIAKKPVIERKTSIREAARCGCKRHSGIGKRGKMPRLRVEHAAHCAPLERGNFGVSHSIHMSIRWIEEFDADTSWMLLVDRIIPPRDNGVLSSNTRRMASGARCPAYGAVEHP